MYKTLLAVFSFLHPWLIQKDCKLEATLPEGSSKIDVTIRLSHAVPISLVMFDATGKYIYLKNFQLRDTEIHESIDLSRYPKGIYILEAESNNFRESTRLIYQ